MIDKLLPHWFKRISSVLFCFLIISFLYLRIFNSSLIARGQVKANVHVIIDKLPLDDQQKMKDFHSTVKSYIENVNWLEEDDVYPIEVTIQMFLTDSPSNIEDRYRCEFLISSGDVQYFDKRVRFPYTPGDPLIYNEQNFEPLTGVINFYINMILGNELDKYSKFGGDVYYKRALNIASLGKFSRTEFILGWTEREELIKRVFQEPFTTFRKMKDYYFYGLYVKDDDIKETRQYLTIALDMIQKVLEKQSDLEELKQFFNAHYLDFIEIFKDDKNKNEVFKKLKALDPDHKKLYEEHISES